MSHHWTVRCNVRREDGSRERIMFDVYALTRQDAIDEARRTAVALHYDDVNINHVAQRGVARTIIFAESERGRQRRRSRREKERERHAT